MGLFLITLIVLLFFLALLFTNNGLYKGQALCAVIAGIFVLTSIIILIKAVLEYKKEKDYDSFFKYYEDEYFYSWHFGFINRSTQWVVVLFFISLTVLSVIGNSNLNGIFFGDDIKYKPEGTYCYTVFFEKGGERINCPAEIKIEHHDKEAHFYLVKIFHPDETFSVDGNTFEELSEADNGYLEVFINEKENLYFDRWFIKDHHKYKEYVKDSYFAEYGYELSEDNDFYYDYEEHLWEIHIQDIPGYNKCTVTLVNDESYHPDCKVSAVNHNYLLDFISIFSIIYTTWFLVSCIRFSISKEIGR